MKLGVVCLRPRSLAGRVPETGLWTVLRHTTPPGQAWSPDSCASDRPMDRSEAHDPAPAASRATSQATSQASIAGHIAGGAGSAQAPGPAAQAPGTSSRRADVCATRAASSSSGGIGDLFEGQPARVEHGRPRVPHHARSSTSRAHSTGRAPPRRRPGNPTSARTIEWQNASARTRPTATPAASRVQRGPAASGQWSRPRAACRTTRSRAARPAVRPRRSSRRGPAGAARPARVGARSGSTASAESAIR